MNERAVPEDDHVARYCRPLAVRKGKVTSRAFLLRQETEKQPEEEYLSVNWLEYFGDRDKKIAMRHVRSAFEQNFHTSENGRYAILKVRRILDLGIQLNPPRQMSVMHLPRPDNPCHSGILGYTASETSVAVKLLLLVDPDDFVSGVQEQEEPDTAETT